MGRKSKRSLSRKLKRKHSRRSRRRGGADALEGAPLDYSLSGNWASRMSLGQGADYFKYHEGQHGGNYEMAPMGAPLRAITHSTLPEDLRGPAHLRGIDMAFKDIAGLKDQQGGRRRRRKGMKSRKGKRHGGKSRRGKSHRGKSRRHRRRGGSLEYAPFGGPTMLLDSPKEYAQAGLNPEWNTDIAFTDAKIRDSQ